MNFSTLNNLGCLTQKRTKIISVLKTGEFYRLTAIKLVDTQYGSRGAVCITAPVRARS